MATYEKAVRSLSGTRAYWDLGRVLPSYAEWARHCGAVSYWGLGELTGNVVDSIGGGTSTSHVGTPARNSGSRNGMWDEGSITYNGVSSATLLPDIHRFEGNAPFTIMGWVYAWSAQASMHFIAKDDGVDGWGVQLQGGSASTLAFFVFRRGASSADIVASPANLSTLTWYHFAATYDGSTLSVYVNGALAGSAASTLVIGPNTGQLTFGRASGGNLWANVNLDDVSIHERAVTPYEVAESYALGIEMFRDKGPALDHAAASHNTLLDVGPTPDMPFATRFANGGIDLGDTAEFDFPGTAAFSVTWWQYADSLLGAGQYGRVISKGAGTDYYRIIHGNGGGLLGFTRSTTAGGLKEAARPIVAGVWQHCAAVYTGTQLIMYTDGVASAPVADTGSMPAIAANLFIGGHGVSNSQNWQGALRALAIHNRALTAAEVAFLSSSRYGLEDGAGRGLLARGAGGDRRSWVLPYIQGVSGKSIALPFEQEGPLAVASWVLPYTQRGDVAKAVVAPFSVLGPVTARVDAPFAILDDTTGVDAWGGIIAPLMGWSDPAPPAPTAYRDALVSTPGILSLYRLGESSGNALDHLGAGPPLVPGGTLSRNVPGGVRGDPDGAVGIGGVSGNSLSAADHEPFRFSYHQPYSVLALARRDGAGGVHPAVMVNGASDGWILYDFSGTTVFMGRAITYMGTVRALAPSSHWRMGEASGSVVDSIGSVTGATAGTVTRDATGALVSGDDGAIDLDGATGHITFSDVYDFSGMAPYTISMWVRPDALVAGARLISKTNGTTSGYDVYLTNGSGAISYARGEGGLMAVLDSANSIMTTGAWQHIAIVYDGYWMNIFRNGVRVAGPVAHAGSNPGDAEVLTIGRSSSVASGYFDGKVDEVTFWQRPLTDEQVARLYTCGTATYSGTYWTGGPSWGVDSTWHLVGATFDGRYTKVWLDGVSGSASDNVEAILEPNAGGFVVGPTFNGAIDEVALLGRGLSDAEMVRLADIWRGTQTQRVDPPVMYSDVILADSPLAYWRFDEDPVADAMTILATDETGQHHASFATQASFGGIPLKPNGPGTRSVRWGSASGALLSIAVTSAPNLRLDPIPYKSFSVECWMSPRSGWSPGFAMLERASCFLLRVNAGAESNAISWFVIHDGNAEPRATTSVTVVAGTVYHVVGTYARNASDTGGTVTLYVNGVAVDSEVRTGALAVNSNPLLVGYGYANALMSDVAVYGYALSAAQVAAHHAAG